MNKETLKSADDFCRLVSSLVHQERSTQKEVAERLGISTKTLVSVLKGEFPGPPNNPDSIMRWQDGRVHSLTRICDGFGLNVFECLHACGLPSLEGTISRSRKEFEQRSAHALEKLSSIDLVLGADELGMLQRQLENTGPIPFRMVPELVRMFREKQAQ